MRDALKVAEQHPCGGDVADDDHVGARALDGEHHVAQLDDHVGVALAPDARVAVIELVRQSRGVFEREGVLQLPATEALERAEAELVERLEVEHKLRTRLQQRRHLHVALQRAGEDDWGGGGSGGGGGGGRCSGGGRRGRGSVRRKGCRRAGAG
eukprot:6199524-Pleurochrysis_carterae.AAC.4